MNWFPNDVIVGNDKYNTKQITSTGWVYYREICSTWKSPIDIEGLSLFYLKILILSARQKSANDWFSLIGSANFHFLKKKMLRQFQFNKSYTWWRNFWLNALLIFRYIHFLSALHFNWATIKKIFDWVTNHIPYDVILNN